MVRTPWNKGKVGLFQHSEYSKRKVSLSLIGNKRHAGIPVSPETKLKMSLAHKGKKTKRIYGSSWNKGLTKESDIRVRRLGIKGGKTRKIRQVQSGSNNSNWRGGITPEIIKRANNPEWIKKRKATYKRDGYTCQNCGKMNCKLSAHHVVPYRISRNNNMKNLITLCESCHKKIEHQGQQYLPISLLD